MDDPNRRPPRRRIESLDEQEFEARLRDAARGVCPERVMDDLEVQHLMRVVTECSLLLADVYSDERIARILHPERGLLGHVLARLDADGGAALDLLRRVRRLPDEARILGNKALFDSGLLGLRRVRGYDLEELGPRAYRAAGQALELLAEDRRLQELFKQNRLLMLPLEQEVVFLRQCSEKFRLYTDILKQIQRQAPIPSIAELARRVPLMAAAAEALVGAAPEDEAPAAPAEQNGYAEAARADPVAHPGSPERTISDWERLLLFSSLDLARLQSALDATVVDQPQAVRALCDEFSLFAAGTRDPRKPPAYFLVGPTGVGKNHLVETMRRVLGAVWGLEIPTLTLEGPNYTYPSDINELRGATRGFIRSDEEGLLTTFHQRSSRAPLAVLLVDEVEKAHPHLMTFFLSILDRGTTTDNRGQVLDFSNCLIFFTSNIGYSDAQRGSAPIGYFDQPARQATSDRDVRTQLRRQLRPEFVNRLRTIHFERLGPHSVERILDLEFARVAARYHEVHGLALELDPAAREELIRRGFSPVFGARHLAATIEGVCNVEIAKKLRQDDRGTPADSRRALIDWLREAREGRRAYSPEELARRVQESARAHVDYRGLRVVFRDGAFDYVALRDEAS